MKNTSKTILFFGNERLVSGLPKSDTPLLKGLIAAGYQVAAVISHHSDELSRKKRPLEVAEIAGQHDIPLLTPDKPADIIEELKKYKADIAILAAYGRIIPQSVIDIFPDGIINLHPSLLPTYRGSTPIESAILNHDKRAGVSIMQLSSDMDAGPVYVQASVNLSGHENKFELHDILSKLGSQLLLDNLPKIIDGSLKPLPQDELRATYCQTLKKSDGIFDPSSTSAIGAEAKARAYLNFPKYKYSLGENTIIITKAHVSDQSKTPLDILCQDGEYLSIDELVAPSGRTMDAAAFIRGYL